MSGPELVQRPRTWQPGVKVIFMSGHTPETVLQHGGVGAGTAFLQKPFDIDDLLAQIRKLLAQGRPGKPRRRAARDRATKR